MVPNDLFSQTKSRYLHKKITGHCRLFDPTKTIKETYNLNK